MMTTPEKFWPLNPSSARHVIAETGVLTLGEPARVIPHRGNPSGRRTPESGGFLVEVHPGEELPAGFCTKLGRILVPTALDDPSATALEYASALALGFGSELALLHVMEDPMRVRASAIEAEFRKYSAAIQARDLRTRLFLRAGLVCEQVKAVANVLKADLIVTSHDYHHRFLRCLQVYGHRGGSIVQGVQCPVVLVHASADANAFRTGVSLDRRLCPLEASAA